MRVRNKDIITTTDRDKIEIPLSSCWLAARVPEARGRRLRATTLLLLPPLLARVVSFVGCHLRPPLLAAPPRAAARGSRQRRR